MTGDGARRGSVGFIGGGRITRIILSGWQRAGEVPDDVVVCDVDGDALERIEGLGTTARVVDRRIEEAAACRVVFLAVHPPVIRSISGTLTAALGPETVVVSLAPKLTIAALSSMLGGFSRVIRVIPNAASLVGAGYNPVVFGERVMPADRAEVAALLAPLGEAPEVAEPELEAYAILTAMGPTYFWPQLYQLVALAEEFGLAKTPAYTGMERMLSGAVATMRAGLSLEEAMGLVSVRPLASLEPQILEGYEVNLRKLYEAIKP
ncbi:MAG: NAD(P)-binding domain-containing protein [Acidimicrobiia bacterium]